MGIWILCSLEAFVKSLEQIVNGIGTLVVLGKGLCHFEPSLKITVVGQALQ